MSALTNSEWYLKDYIGYPAGHFVGQLSEEGGGKWPCGLWRNIFEDERASVDIAHWELEGEGTLNVNTMLKTN